MTRITIEVNGPSSVHTHVPGALPAQGQAGAMPAISSGGYDAGAAPSVDASHAGPVPFMSAAAGSAQEAAFSTEGAISAGAAPAHLMGGAE
jgi:hypothetical protein